MSRQVALLYSVILDPGRRVRSAELLALAGEAGFGAARTVLASGNLIFDSDLPEAALEARLEAVIGRIFGRPIPVIVRDAAAWRALVAGNPFPAETRDDPARVAVRVLRAAPAPAVLARIAARRAEGERMALDGRALWLATPGQLSASPMFRAAGAAWAGEGTLRNASAAARIAAALDRTPDPACPGGNQSQISAWPAIVAATCVNLGSGYASGLSAEPAAGVGG